MCLSIVNHPCSSNLTWLFDSFSEGLPEGIILLTATWRTVGVPPLCRTSPASALQEETLLHHTCALVCLRHDIEMFIQEAMIHRLFYNKGYQYLRHEEREGAGGGGLGLEV